MRYWVAKAQPRNWEADEYYRPGVIGDWWTRKPVAVGVRDRVFCWKSSPAREIVALASVREIREGTEPGDRTTVRITYRSRIFARPLGLEELRKSTRLRGASFLRAGPVATFYPLTELHAAELYALTVAANPELERVWPQLLGARIERGTTGDPDGSGEPVVEEDCYVEGSRVLKLHLAIERNRRVIERKKQEALDRTGRLRCECCGFDFVDVYGELGKGFSEVHHREPLGQAGGSVKTRLEDLAVVCSNCHRMLHRSKLALSVEELSRRLYSRAAKGDPKSAR